MPNPPAWFRDGIRSLTPDDLAVFVADVWRARGREVRRDGAVLHVENGTDGDLVLYVTGGESSIPDGVDAVVTADPAPELAGKYDAIGATELYEHVRFALSSAESKRLISDHLDKEPDIVDPEAPSGSVEDSGQAAAARAVDGADTAEAGRVPADTESSGDVDVAEPAEVPPAPTRPSRRSILVGAGGFLAGLGTAAAGWVGPLGPAGRTTADDNTSGTPTPEPEPVVAVPGLSRDGVSDPAVLADAHLTRLDAASYSITSTQTVHRPDGSLLASLGLTTRVTEERRMHVQLATAGRASPEVFGEPPIRATLYSDGEQQFRRFVSDGETDYAVVELGAEVNGWFYWANIFPFGSLFISVIDYIQGLFGAVPVSLDSPAGDGEPPYTLHATSVRVDPLPQVFDSIANDSPARNLDLQASVTGAGLVRSLGLEFAGRRVRDRVSVGVSYNYLGIGGTTVEPPDWLGEARAGNGSGGRDVASPPRRS